MKTIRFERQNALGRIVLANPPYNRLDLNFSEYLRQAVHDASESDIRVLVIQAEGPHFSFGGEVREWPGKDLNWFRTFVAEVNLSYRAIEALRVPTIAAVQGVAFGGLRLHCRRGKRRLPLRGGDDGNAANCRRAAAPRRARRSGTGIALLHAWRTDSRLYGRPAWDRDARRARGPARAVRGGVGPETGGRADKVIRRDPNTSEGLVGGRRAGSRRHDARHHHGSLQYRGLHARLFEYGRGVRSRH